MVRADQYFLKILVRDQNFWRTKLTVTTHARYTVYKWRGCSCGQLCSTFWSSKHVVNVERVRRTASACGLIPKLQNRTPWTSASSSHTREFFCYLCVCLAWWPWRFYGWTRNQSGADLGGRSRGSGPPPPPPPLSSYMKNDVMHTVIYEAFCMLPSLDLQDCTSF